MSTQAMMWHVFDDSNGNIQGREVFQSNDRAAAVAFYGEYEKIGNNVALLQRIPQWPRSYEND
jgi:hypothetical protein